MASSISTVGSGKNIHVQGDLNSAVVGELVEQMNSAESIATVNFVAAATGTHRLLIGVFKDPVFVKRVTVVNGNTAALANAATDIFVHTCALGDVDMQGGPGADLQTLVSLQGFATSEFPAQTAKTGAELMITGVSAGADSADAVAGANTNVVVAANSAIYAEIVNTEASSATATVAIQVHYCTTDRVTIEPDGLSSGVPKRNRKFNRKSRSN
jgi:hypothetical protein